MSKYVLCLDRYSGCLIDFDTLMCSLMDTPVYQSQINIIILGLYTDYLYWFQQIGAGIHIFYMIKVFQWLTLYLGHLNRQKRAATASIVHWSGINIYNALAHQSGGHIYETSKSGISTALDIFTVSNFLWSIFDKFQL